MTSLEQLISTIRNHFNFIQIPHSQSTDIDLTQTFLASTKSTNTGYFCILKMDSSNLLLFYLYAGSKERQHVYALQFGYSVTHALDNDGYMVDNIFIGNNTTPTIKIHMKKNQTDRNKITITHTGEINVHWSSDLIILR